MSVFARVKDLGLELTTAWATISGKKPVPAETFHMDTSKPQQPISFPDPADAHERLDSWKEIAVYLKRDERTVRRWEKEGLPVHRKMHKKQASVFAYIAEIDAWWNDGRQRLEPGCLPSSTPPIPREKSLVTRWRRAWLPVLGAAVVIAGAFTFNFAGIRNRISAPQVPTIRSIAVLPLENLSGDANQEYFVDGMTDELITDLASIARLRVISRTSTTHYKNSRKTIPEIARELNVDAVLEGSVGRSANAVRIRAQLVRAAPEEHLWAASYERDFPDVLALQHDVAKAIANEIKIKLTPEENERLANARQVDPEAYQMYLRGRFSFESWTRDAVRLARKNFQMAIEKDPNYAPSYAGLADTYVFGATGLEPNVSIPLARAAAMKAIELDDSVGDAHAALAEVKFMGDWDWAGAEKEFRRAIASNPGDTLAHHMYSHFLLAMGRDEESLRESQVYLQVDPLSAPANNHLAWHYVATAQYDLAIQYDSKAVQIDPNYVDAIYGLAEAYRHKGMAQEALTQYQKMMTLSGARPELINSLRRTYETEGWKGYWQKSLDQDLERANREYVSFYDIALDYALLADKAQAFRYLEKAYADHEGLLTWIKAERNFDILHSDPRFQDLLRRVGLPQ